jgi:hypothetical protein
MKRASRRRSVPNKPTPSADQIRQYVQLMSDQHQKAWQHELHSKAPHWTYLLGLHLRMVELDHLEAAAAELL